MGTARECTVQQAISHALTHLIGRRGYRQRYPRQNVKPCPGLVDHYIAPPPELENLTQFDALTLAAQFVRFDT